MAGIVALALVAHETYPLVANVYSSNEIVHPATGPMMGSILSPPGSSWVRRDAQYVMPPPGSGVRPPSWAAREAMVDAGIATADDVERWDRAFTARIDDVVNFFVAAHLVIGGRPQRESQRQSLLTSSRRRPEALDNDAQYEPVNGHRNAPHSGYQVAPRCSSSGAGPTYVASLGR